MRIMHFAVVSFVATSQYRLRKSDHNMQYSIGKDSADQQLDRNRPAKRRALYLECWFFRRPRSALHQ